MTASEQHARRTRWVWALFAFALAAALARPASAQINVTPPELKGVDVVEHLGGSVPLDAAFTDADGRSVRLGDVMDGKRPTLLVFAYHTCPMLCSLVLDGAAKAARQIPWTVGREYDVVSISIDPRDTPASAARKRAQVVESYGRHAGAAPAPTGWHFLVGDELNIRRVTEAAGFTFRYDDRQGQYAHPAVIFLLTPVGRLARYLYGFQFDPQDLRLGLLEASEGRSISTVERLLLYCYHYDPQGKRYALVALRVMRLGGVVTMVLLGTFLTLLWRRERRREHEGPPSKSAGVPPPPPTPLARTRAS